MAHDLEIYNATRFIVLATLVHVCGSHDLISLQFKYIDSFSWNVSLHLLACVEHHGWVCNSDFLCSSDEQ